MLSKDEIIRVLSQSNFWGNEQYTGIPRKGYLGKLAKMKDMKEAIAILGVRRSGKSTLAKQFLEKVIKDGNKKEQTLYVNFEEPVFTPHLNLDLLDYIYDAYRENVNHEDFAYVVLDEVQNIPAWEKWVRTRQENERIKIIVTGSSSKLLSSEFSTVLSGRSVPLPVFPLSFHEFLEFKKAAVRKAGEVFLDKRKINILLKEYLEFGGFPRVVLETRENKKALLDEYFEAIVLRDVAARYNVRETGLLRAFATVLLNNSSSPVSIARLAGILQESFKQRISLETVSRFLAYTESAFLAFLVPIFSYKIKEQMRYPRKAYCIDTGMRNAVSFRFSQDMGRLYENLVFLELNRMGLDIYYWKDRQGREVDFVIKNGTKVREAVQVCFDASKAETRKREVRALMKCMDEFRLKEGLIITETEDEEDNIGGKKIIFRPLWKWIMQHR